MPNEQKFETAQQRDAAIRDAEAMSRKEESTANVYRGQARRTGDKAYQSGADEAAQNATKAAQEMDAAREANVPRNLEGTAPTLADINGNFAPNVAVANVGGIGVVGSNSVEGGEELATDPQNAGTITDVGPLALVGPGGRPVTAKGEPLQAPEGTETTAAKVSGGESVEARSAPRKGK